MVLQNADVVPASTGGTVVDVVGGRVVVGGCVLDGAWVLVGGCDPMVVVGAVEDADATVTFGGWLSATVVSEGAASSAGLDATLATVVFAAVASRLHADGVPSAFVVSGAPPLSPP